MDMRCQVPGPAAMLAGKTPLYPLYTRPDGFQRPLCVVQNIRMARNKYINIDIFKQIQYFQREGFPFYALIILLYLQRGKTK
jgi:hypothetical protein